MGYFTVFVGVVEGLVPSKLAGVELGCVMKRLIFQGLQAQSVHQNLECPFEVTL